MTHDELIAELEWCAAEGHAGPRTKRALEAALSALRAAPGREPAKMPALPTPYTAQIMCGENTALYTADQMTAYASAVAAALAAPPDEPTAGREGAEPVMCPKCNAESIEEARSMCQGWQHGPDGEDCPIGSVRDSWPTQPATPAEEAQPSVETRTVTIPASAEHEGLFAMTVTLPWVCLKCGGPRGEPFPTISYDGSRRLHCDGWTNPCGHVETYSAVRAAFAAPAEEAQPDDLAMRIIDAWNRHVPAPTAIIAARARAEEAQPAEPAVAQEARDAARYRWLKAHGRCDSKHGTGAVIGTRNAATVAFRYWCEPDLLDAAIDAAMKEQP